MCKPEEREFRQLVVDSKGRIPQDMWSKLTKRQFRYLEKWEDRGWWDSGVSVRTGWLTVQGWDKFQK